MRSPSRTAPLILVVDDDDAVREALRDLLTAEGFRVTVAANGRQALKRLRVRAEAPQAVVLDLIMPVMTGWEFHAEKRADPRLAPIPVVVLTAAGETAMTPEGVALRLPKPFPLDNLLEALRSLCAEPDRRLHAESPAPLVVAPLAPLAVESPAPPSVEPVVTLSGEPVLTLSVEPPAPLSAEPPVTPPAAPTAPLAAEPSVTLSAEPAAPLAVERPVALAPDPPPDGGPLD